MVVPCIQVVVVLPTNRKDRYDSIKKLCCKEMPGNGWQPEPKITCSDRCLFWSDIYCSFFLPLVPSQCILARTLQKKQQLMSVVTKVAMQINCKLGGELWALEIPVSPIWEEGRVA